MDEWEQRIRAATLAETLSLRVRADFSACIKELDALRKNDKRYRWLRAVGGKAWTVLEAQTPAVDGLYDAAVDAAMAGQG